MMCGMFYLPTRIIIFKKYEAAQDLIFMNLLNLIRNFTFAEKKEAEKWGSLWRKSENWMGLSLIRMWHLSGRIRSWKMCCMAGWGTINANVTSAVKELIALLVLVLSLITEWKRLNNQPAKTHTNQHSIPTEPFLFKVQNNELIIYWEVFFLSWEILTLIMRSLGT